MNVSSALGLYNVSQKKKILLVSVRMAVHKPLFACLASAHGHIVSLHSGDSAQVIDHKGMHIFSMYLDSCCDLFQDIMEEEKRYFFKKEKH